MPEGAKPDIQKIVTASLHAREIIKKLLLFARQTPTFKGPVDLNQVVLSAIDLFKHQFEKEGIELSCVLCPQMPVLAADAGQLTQVLVNLVVNAVQAMPGGGKLVVQTQVQDGHVVCSVEDTGVGMTEDVLDRLFVPFFTTKEVNRDGSGPARGPWIVTSHGGVKVTSSPARNSPFDCPRQPLLGERAGIMNYLTGRSDSRCR
jgi:signal transduction histidine kinase